MLYRENGQFKTTYKADQQIFPILQDRVVVLAFIVLAVFAVPLFTTDYAFRAIINPFLILALATIGLNLLVGYCGQISLGSGAFMAVGAYSAYNLALHFPWLNLILVFILSGCDCNVGRRCVRCAEPAHQGFISGGGNFGRAVFFRLAVCQGQVVHQLCGPRDRFRCRRRKCLAF